MKKPNPHPDAVSLANRRDEEGHVNVGAGAKNIPDGWSLLSGGYVHTAIQELAVPTALAVRFEKTYSGYRRIVLGDLVPGTAAARVATLAHDIEMAAGKPGAALLRAALSVAEREGWTGRQIEMLNELIATF